MTSNGFGFADPPAGLRCSLARGNPVASHASIFALAPVCFANAHLRSVPQPLCLMVMVYWLGDQPAALVKPIRTTNRASAKVMMPMTMLRALRSLISPALSSFSGGGGSRRMRDTRDPGAARSTLFFLPWSGLAMRR